MIWTSQGFFTIPLNYNVIRSSTTTKKQISTTKTRIGVTNSIFSFFLFFSLHYFSLSCLFSLVHTSFPSFGATKKIFFTFFLSLSLLPLSLSHSLCHTEWTTADYEREPRETLTKTTTTVTTNRATATTTTTTRRTLQHTSRRCESNTLTGYVCLAFFLERRDSPASFNALRLLLCYTYVYICGSRARTLSPSCYVYILYMYIVYVYITI